MDANYEDRNKSQIIRQDARNCFVESKNDAFGIGKAHLEFATYDVNKPTGQRQTNNVHIYIDIPELLCLAQEALSGLLHARARHQKANKDTTPLYQCLGGTSAEKLRQYGRSRTDGKSLSRIVKLIYSDKKDDFYLFVADSGPGEADAKGLIVPKFGNSPENHVAVGMNWRDLNGFLIMTKTHYEAWLAAKYMSENSAVSKIPQPPQQSVPQHAPTKQSQQPQKQSPPPVNNTAEAKTAGSGNANTNEYEMQMF